MTAKEPLLPMRVCEQTGHTLVTTIYERKGKKREKTQCLFCNKTRIKKLEKREDG